MKTKYSVMLSLIFVSSLYTQHFSVEIDPTGISQLIVFSDSLSGLNPGDEIGIFDSDGILNSGDCSNQTGNVLVGSGIWTGEQLNSVAIGSIDYCAINGFQYAGYVEGHPIQFRVYKPDLMLEFEVEATFSMGNGIFGDLLIMVTELSFPQQYYNLEINPTGEYQLIVFLETITGLNPDDEIGIFDTAGILNSGDCSNQTGELLVGTGIWTGEQNNISAIGSIDYCAVGGYQWAGWVEGNPVNIRVYRPELEMELEPDITFFEGSGEFGETLIVISELTLSVFGCMDVNACNYDPDVIFDDGTCMYEIDCNGECGGDAILDNCGVCDNDPLNDNECYFDGPQNLIAAGGDGEIILNWDIPNWDHSRSSATLYITDVTSEYIEISMINDEDVYGIQFQIQASGLSPNFIGAAGGTAELAGFEFQFSEDGLFIGFDMDGGFIAPGNATLTTISWEIENTDEWVFINNSVISGYNGDEITYNSGAPFCLGVCDPPLDFTIYRDDEFLQNISGTTEFTDTGLPEGITHCYTVSWNFDEYESNLSNEACATTFVFDCAGVQNGGAYFDECDNCCAGTTGVECSYWESEENFGGLMDCSGECEGTAWINDCGCVEGNTGYEFDFCYGCTDPAASNYDPQAIFDCNGDNSCCEYPVLLSLQNADYANSTLDLYIDTPVDIGGFSITFLGTTLDSVSGGLAEEYGYDVTISGNTIIGVPNEEPIPSQSGMLSRLTLDSPGYTYILIVNSVINSVENEPLPVENGEGFSWQPGYGWENCGDLGLFADCNGTCFSNYQLSMVGDGVCDQSESFLDFFCAEWNYDEGDCVGQPLTFVQGTTSESNGWITVTSTTFSGSAGMPLTVQIGPPFIVGNGGDTPPPENEEYSSWDVFLAITNFEDGVIEISMNNYEVVAGFQFNIITSFSDFEVSGAGGGSAGNAGFMISTNLSGLVLGFSLAGSSIDENQGGCGAGEFVDCNGNCFPNSELSHLGDDICNDDEDLNLNCVRLDFDGGDCLDLDCSGTRDGEAHYDDCGICCDGNTGIECSYWNGPDDFGGSMDCTGICFGSAVIDACEICAGGDTGLEPNYCDEEMDGMICWGEYSGPDFDNCGECFGNTRTPDCTGTCFGTAFENECGCVGGSTGLAPDFCYGCTDPEAVNYDPDATIDDGSCITDFDVYLYISDVTESSIEISMVNNEMVFGFQFTIMSSPELGAIFSDASGGLAQQYGFMMSTNSEGVVLGFSLTGGFIPVGSGVLTNVSWSHSGSAGYLTLDQMIFSGVGGSAFNSETGDSYQIGSGYDVYGCTDPEALNYDPYANLDDGSCIYDESISQSIDLTSEHLNWVSFHVYPDQSDIRIIFQPLIDNSSLISVNGSNGGGLYLSNSEWINTIGNIEIDEVYMVHVNFDTQFQVQGELIQLPVSSYLSEGLNMIGYPLNVSQSVTGVFQPFIDAGIILSISNDLGQMIIPEYGISQFDEFIPGEGYNISVNTPMVVRFCENQSDCNSIIYGCTEMTACNYNPEATIDDGTCWDCVIGDVNFDGSFDILDVVAIVSIIMGTQPYNPAADLNGDGNVDALDIVSVISIILGTGDPPGVTETANVQFTETSACFVADFTVQVLQMTIQHGEDFELTINENAQEAEYETQGNFTTINFVLPEGPELFVTNNAFVIEEVQVSSQAGYAEVEVYYGSCGSEPEFIFGCTDEGSCNFEPEAMIDNGSCEYFDCFGDCGGNALEDECGACCDGNTGAECSWYNGIDDFGGVYDCAGFCYGPAYLGEDGYCYINPADAGSYPYDDDFWDCNWEVNGSASFDDCGVCSGGHTDLEPNICEGNLSDMYCDGSFVGPDFDECGLCFGENADMDCMGACFGSAYEDGCGVCDEIPENDNISCTGCMDETAWNYDETALFDCNECCVYTIQQPLTVNALEWNSISINVIPLQPEVSEIFVPEQILMVRDDATHYYLPSYNVNTIGDLVVGKGYEVYPAGEADQNFSTEGFEVNPSDYPIELLPLFWNNIGYLLSEPFPITQIMADLPILIVKDSDAFYYVPSYGVNSIDSHGGMQPGKGYQVYLTGNEPAVLIYDSTSLTRTNIENMEITESEPRTEYYSIQSTGQPYPIVITRIIGDFEAGDEIAVLANGIPVGALSLTDMEFPFVLTAWRGSEESGVQLNGWLPGDEISFRYWDHTSGLTDEIISDPPLESIGNAPFSAVRLIRPINETIPSEYALHPAYPNPFNSATKLTYDLPEELEISIVVMDLLGRKIDELVNNDNPQPPGRYTVRWDGRKCTSGIYLVKMTSSRGTIIQKVMLIK